MPWQICSQQWVRTPRRGCCSCAAPATGLGHGGRWRKRRQQRREVCALCKRQAHRRASRRDSRIPAYCMRKNDRTQLPTVFKNLNVHNVKRARRIVPKIAEALNGRSPKLVAIVHAETSTGALTPLDEISKLAHDSGALFLVDSVTSLAGCPVHVDDWGIDAIYSGTQKCLSCPPGLAPVSLSDRAMKVIACRTSGVQSWYLDVNLLANYWGEGARVYHHTAPISMNYALHESLRLVLEEGLENRWARHEANHVRLRKGLAELGLGIASQEGHQLWQLNAVTVPEGVDEAGVRKSLLADHGIEIGPGLGPLAGKVWRIGLMGHSSSEGNVGRVLAALKSQL